MKKYMITMMMLCGTGLITWFLAPCAFIYTLPSCQLKTTFITEEPNRTVVAQGSWILRNTMGKGTGSYSGRINDYDTTGKPLQAEKRVHTSFVTDYEAVGWAIQTTTTESQLNMGNTTPIDEIARYVYPSLRAGFSGLHYLFDINNHFLASGLDNDPRVVCISQT